MDLKSKNAQWRDGATVSGRYCGIPYTGQLIDHDGLCRWAPDGRSFIFHVEFSPAIEVFGQMRERADIWQNSNDTIFAL